MKNISWTPILPLAGVSDPSVHLDLARLDNARRIWVQTKAELELEPEVLQRFMARLNRSIAVETGIIEGLYEIDRGLTQTLVTHGFTRDVADRSGESVPELTLHMLRDHLDGLEFIMDYIGGEVRRDLTTSYIRELHAKVTYSQTSSNAVDRFGNHIELDLLHGEYKQQPNNPLTRAGSLHEYAPVEQVASQMDELVRLYYEIEDGQHAVVKAAWLHHRFTQIHPFQDGNGRVARLLASMVLIKADYFPLHIRRQDRQDYLDALEQADAERLEPLISLMSRRVHEDIFDTVSEAAKEVVKQTQAGGRGDTSLTQNVAALVAAERQRHQAEVLADRRQVNRVAESLLPHMATTIEKRIDEARTEFVKLQMRLDGRVESGGAHDGHGHYWREQIVQTAREHNYWANQLENRYWIRSYLALNGARLRMVVSLHHVGRIISGSMAVSAFAEVLHHSPEQEVYSDQDRPYRKPVRCIDNVFKFTEADDEEQLRRDLDAWVDEALAVTLRILGTSST